MGTKCVQNFCPCLVHDETIINCLKFVFESNCITDRSSKRRSFFFFIYRVHPDGIFRAEMNTRIFLNSKRSKIATSSRYRIYLYINEYRLNNQFFPILSIGIFKNTPARTKWGGGGGIYIYISPFRAFSH